MISDSSDTFAHSWSVADEIYRHTIRYRQTWEIWRTIEPSPAPTGSSGRRNGRRARRGVTALHPKHKRRIPLFCSLTRGGTAYQLKGITRPAIPCPVSLEETPFLGTLGRVMFADLNPDTTCRLLGLSAVSAGSWDRFRNGAFRMRRLDAGGPTQNDSISGILLAVIAQRLRHPTQPLF